MNSNIPDGSSNNSNGFHGSSSSSQQRQALLSQLCQHVTDLIQYSNNTADIPAHYRPQNPNAKAQLLDPWHPEDLTDAAAGLAAAGIQSQAAAQVLDAIAHEVYRQLSNRHSAAGSFTVDGTVNLLGSYADLQYKDGGFKSLLRCAMLAWVGCVIPAKNMYCSSHEVTSEDYASLCCNLFCTAGCGLHIFDSVPDGFVMFTSAFRCCLMPSAAADTLHFSLSWCYCSLASLQGPVCACSMPPQVVSLHQQEYVSLHQVTSLLLTVHFCFFAGPSLRMFDAVAGWLVKRVRARHVQAPSSPQQLAAVAAVYARLQHRSVVVPELLTALDMQVVCARVIGDCMACCMACAQQPTAVGGICSGVCTHGCSTQIRVTNNHTPGDTPGASCKSPAAAELHFACVGLQGSCISSAVEQHCSTPHSCRVLLFVSEHANCMCLLLLLNFTPLL
jgi:hypothetical protein